ncbi:MAG: hypothetical protein JWO05_3648 [Gemmatimonadetes bacterium]|nr:hypothetical protein [Gemmatimonadota bacterium]
MRSTPFWTGSPSTLVAFLAATTMMSACDHPAGPDKSKPAYCASATLALAPGEVRMLGATDQCLVIPAGSANYVLTYVDTRAITSAKTGEFTGTGAYTVKIRDAGSTIQSLFGVAARSGGEGASTLVMLPSLSTRQARASRAAAAACVNEFTDFSCQPHPWFLGDEIQLHSDLPDRTLTARVFHVAGPLVLALPVGEEKKMGAEVLEAARLAANRVALDVLPMLKRAFGDTLPVTSVATDQLLALFDVSRDGRTQVTITHLAGAKQVSGVMLMSMSQGSTEAPMFHSLTRQVTELMEAQYSLGAGATAPLSFSTPASVSGVAELYTAEALRRAASQPLDANLDVAAAAASGDPYLAEYASEVQFGYGDVESGGGNTRSFLRDLVQRARRKGASQDSAMRAVSRGSLNGWYVRAGDLAERTSLTTRMRALLDPAWDPATALLTWTLSAALDDLTPNAELANTDVKSVWHEWVPDAQCLTFSGGVEKCQDAQALTLGAGNSLQITTPGVGYAGYIPIVSGAARTTVRLTGSVSGIAWAIARR